MKHPWLRWPLHKNTLPAVSERWDRKGTLVTISVQVVVTSKGGTVTRIWNQYLQHITSSMYSDMKDEVGYRVLIKSDLGPGRLNEDIVWT